MGAPGTSAGSGPGSPMSPSASTESTALVVAGDEETRVLLRGLLRLHHFRVVGEAEGAHQAIGLLRQTLPGVLVSDVNLVDGTYSDLLEAARGLEPPPRVILVVPSSRPHAASDGPLHPDVILQRPFRIRQFAEALSGTPVETPSSA
jgi:DNA-binding NarL/FixJ family response regulator